MVNLKLSDDTKFFAQLIFYIGAIIFNFSVGAAEADYLIKYSDRKHGCSDVWSWLVAACVVNIVGSVISCFSIRSLLNNEISHIGMCSVCASFVVDIWAIVTNFNISAGCRAYWGTLMTFVEIHCWSFIVILAVCVLAFLYYFVLGCISVWAPPPKREPLVGGGGSGIR